MSRSAFDGRFRQVLGRSPISYLAVGAVARRVGYDAEPAFSRAFKRHAGSSPAQWRAQPKLRS